jgi:hypothetical protein
MITLIIKGDLHAAVNAAQQRHIPLVSMAQHIRPEFSSVETIASADLKMWDRVTRWYCEDAGRAPFPAGTLLHYSQASI